MLLLFVWLFFFERGVIISFMVALLPHKKEKLSTTMWGRREGRSGILLVWKSREGKERNSPNSGKNSLEINSPVQSNTGTCSVSQFDRVCRSPKWYLPWVPLLKRSRVVEQHFVHQENLDFPLTFGRASEAVLFIPLPRQWQELPQTGQDWNYSNSQASLFLVNCAFSELSVGWSIIFPISHYETSINYQIHGSEGVTEC